jgi:hypothetical protein
MGTNAPLTGLTPGGVGFLKCAFASPDFDVSGSAGVPDMYAGRSLTKLHCLTANVTFNAGRDSTYVIPPAPGVAYWFNSSPTGTGATGNWSSTLFADTMSLFAADSSGLGQGSTNNFNRFRHISLCAEIQPTVNEMLWAGTITCIRNPMSFSAYAGVGTDVYSTPILTGFRPITAPITTNYASSTNQYASPFNEGVYTCSLNRNSTFEFKDIMNSQSATITQTDSTVNSTTVTGPMYGMDDLDSIVFVVSVPEGGSDMTGILRIWAYVEYSPTINSLLYEFSRLSAPLDQRALEYYKTVCSQLPIAVGWHENSNFWTRIMQILQRSNFGATQVTISESASSLRTNSLVRSLQALVL